MKLTIENITQFKNKNVYLQLLASPVDISHTGLKTVNQYNLPIKIKAIGRTVIKCTILPNAGLEQEDINLLLRNLNRRWVLFSEYGEIINNADRTHCLRCGGPTEKRRDFLTFVIRLFCPRCHI